MAKPKGRKADFQKIKLKVGRRLPKGLNVTDTSFKSKKIVIREQLLRENSDGTTKKRGIKEILARLQHYNCGIRHESLLALKELLSTNPNLVQNNIAALIERVCELMVDKEKTVRKTVLAVLREMLQNVSADFITPFFPVLTSYLCCAMTHIHTEIQSDSLKFLDLLLSTFPSLTIMSSSEILKNFLNQISFDKDGRNVRALLVQPNDQTATQKWRLGVLNRVQKFLCVLHESLESEQENGKNDYSSVIEWDGTGSLSVGLLQKGLDPVIANKFSIQDWKQDKPSKKSAEEALEFALVLLPLVLEIWIEASPDKQPHEIGNILSAEASEALECVLQVIWAITKWLEKLDYSNSVQQAKNVEKLGHCFYKDFESFFLKTFPYSPQEVSISKRKGKHNKQQTCLSNHNLLICEVFAILKPAIDGCSGIHYKNVIDYLLNFLNSEVNQDKNSVITAIMIVRMIVKNNVHHSLAVKLLDKMWWMYRHCPSGMEGRHLIEDFFIEIVSSHNYQELVQTQTILSWLEQLPKDILNSANKPERMMELLDKAGDIVSCNYPIFIQSLLSSDLQIIALLENLPFSDEDLFKAQRHIINLICNLPTISGEAFRQLARVLRNPELEVRNVDYLLQNLNFRFQTKSDPGFVSAHYLSLIICTQFGILLNEAPLIKQSFQSSDNLLRLQHCIPQISPFVVVPTEYHMWERHQHISAKAVRYIWDFPESYDVRTAIFTYVTHVLELFRYLPAYATAGILSLVTPFLREPEMDDGYSDNYSQLRFSLFELVLSALSTGAALIIVPSERPRNELRIAEKIFDMVTDFILDTECIEPVCKLMEHNIACLKGVSEAQGECLGLVLSKLLKFDEPEGGSLASMAKILQKIQVLTEGHMSRSKWLNELVYDFKIKAEMSVESC